MTNEDIDKAAKAWCIANDYYYSIDRNGEGAVDEVPSDDGVEAFTAGACAYRDWFVENTKMELRAWEKGLLADALHRIHVSPKDLIAAKDDRIAALEQLAEMVIDPRKMPHQHKDIQTRMYCLQERARELMEVKEVKGA